MKLTALLAATTVAAGLFAASSASAQVTGKVKLDGEAPEPQAISMAADAKCAAAHPNPVLDESIVVGDEGALANVVVSIQAPEGKELKGEAPKDPVIIDQVGCQYIPHVVGVMVGQKVLVKNSDAFLHNVHSLAIDNDPFNFGQPNIDAKGKDVSDKIKVTERFIIKCDVHPWMTVHVNAFEHPFFAVSNEKGEFSLPTKGLEDGKYTLEIWHEKLAPEPITQEIEVKGGKATVEEIKIPADAANARADDAAGAAVTLASLTTDKAAAGEKSCCAPKSKAAAIASAAAATKK
jgi:hypothetical protein